METGEIRIYRGEYANRFTTLPNTLLQNNQLSFRARGMLTYLLSLPANFNLNVSKLIQFSQEGKHAIYGIFDELKAFGYVEKIQIREKGKIKALYYNVYAEPKTVQASGFSPFPENQEMVNAVDNRPFPDFQDPENLDPENQPLINNIYNKKIKKKKETAAKEVRKDHPSEDPCFVAAASDNVFVEDNFSAVETNEKPNDTPSAQDLLIADTLTSSQVKILQLEAKRISSKLNRPIETLFNKLSYEILDKTSFVKCENQFFKKLNVILKLIKENKWTPPAKLYQAKIVEAEKAKTEFFYQKQQLISEISHWQRIKKLYADKSDQGQMNNCESIIAKAQASLASLENTKTTR